MDRKRLYNIDFVKGILIILVIVGHMIPGKVNGNLIRYCIYSFHMPVFITISGYLLNRTYLSTHSLVDVLKRYLPRLMIPWAIGVVVYFFFLNSFRWNLFLKAFIKPYYHLWYILGFISYIIITWILLKLKFNNAMLLAVTLAIGIVSKLRLYDFDNPIMIRVVNLIRYDFRLYNLFFFILGMYLKQLMDKMEKSKIILPFMGAWTALAWILNLFLFYNMTTEWKQLLYYGLNIPMCVVVLLLCKKECFPRWKMFEYIGQQSLFFYLWHVIPILLAVKIVGSKQGILYYGLCIVFLVGLYALIYYRSYRCLKYGK